MIDISQATKEEVLTRQVVARMQGINLQNLPYANAYDHDAGIKSGNLYSYQVDYLTAAGKIHHAKHQLNKSKDLIPEWRKREIEGGLNPMVGINAQERYRMYKNAPARLGDQMEAAIKVFDEIDLGIGAYWRQKNADFYAKVAEIENTHPKSKGRYEKRYKSLAPVVIKYLDEMNEFIATISELYNYRGGDGQA